eukprot:CAMPEP_0114517478 /NCGR_PEP_ID=MMETSP0109-20121206/17915_1 /TAXON_ID=29199 /ORGANISM="Chlorarachnion reptans, Strain CCCM449" /LENGTH=365 /DNA_ID=CAMNT_0001698001 /DNA_START=9 /DNA_END=1106 /DNA_ORIENTATION=+
MAPQNLLLPFPGARPDKLPTLLLLLLFLVPTIEAADENDKFTDQQEDNIAILSIFFSAISFCGSSFIVLTYLRYPVLRTFIFQLVVWISASDIVYSIANGIGNPGDGSDACYAQAVLIQFFGLSSAFWTACIAYTVDRVFLKGYTIDQAQELKQVFHFIVWGVSAFLTILPATTGNYGQSAGWCWIDVRSNAAAGTAWRFVCFYIPLWTVAAYNLSVYSRVRRALADAAGHGEANVKNIRQLQRMVYYPLVLVVCYIFGTISRIQQIFGPPVYGLVILHTIGMSSQGTLNAIVYGLTPSVRKTVFGSTVTEDEPAVDEPIGRLEEKDDAPREAGDKQEEGLVSINLESRANAVADEIGQKSPSGL